MFNGIKGSVLCDKCKFNIWRKVVYKSKQKTNMLKNQIEEEVKEEEKEAPEKEEDENDSFDGEAI